MGRRRRAAACGLQRRESSGFEGLSAGGVAEYIERRGPTQMQLSPFPRDASAAVDELADALVRALEDAALPADAGLVLALSGGPDSCALALAAAHLRHRGHRRGPFTAVCVDHRQQRAASHGQALVRTLAAQLQLPFALFTAHLPRPASEAAMRAARYDALLAVARERGAAAVLTAHHRDDDAETVALRALRGAGPAGLCGMAARRLLAPGVLLLRPLLSLPRARLADACAAHGVRGWHDPTNRDPRQARARVRHVLLPALDRALARPANGALLALAHAARRLHKAGQQRVALGLAHAAHTAAPGRLQLGDRQRPLRAAALAGADWQIALRDAHVAVCGAPPRRGWLARAVALLDADTGAQLTGPVLAERRRHGLLLLDRRCLGPLPPPTALDRPVTPFGATGWSIARRARPAAPRRATVPSRDTAMLDAAAAGGALFVRAPRPDDRMRPLGAPRARRLRPLLAARDVARLERDRLPVVVDSSDRIVWLAGVEIAAHARLTADSQSAIELRLLPTPADHGATPPTARY